MTSAVELPIPLIDFNDQGRDKLPDALFGDLQQGVGGLSIGLDPVGRGATAFQQEGDPAQGVDGLHRHGSRRYARGGFTAAYGVVYVFRHCAATGHDRHRGRPDR